MTPAREVFVDSSYVIALASARDQHHARAVELSRDLEEARTRLVTTRGVLLEIGNALAKQRYRASAVRLLEAIEQDSAVEVAPLTEALYHRAVALYREHADKEWGLTDCVSFAVMRERGVREALTADAHFRQAGFTALLVP